MASDSSFVKETSDTLLKELQTWWEIPSTAQYISLFRESFQLPEIDIEDLEKGFIEDTINGPNKWLQDLIYAFLRSILPGRVNPENWQIQLKKLISRKWPIDKENPFNEDTAFHQLSIRSKVEIVYSLCLYRLDRNDIPEVMKSMDADALRVQKLGSDEAGNTYWYFYGTRLYKEEAEEKRSWNEEWNRQKKQTFKKRGRGRPRKVVLNSEGECDDFDDAYKKNDGYMNVNEKSRWSVVCDTIEEWVNFAEKFKDSKSKDEKALFLIIQENFLPTLNKIYEEKEKKLQQKIRELMPTREKIITRRETRKMRGEVIESPINGYEISDEAHKVHMIKDRARRLEERNKRASEAESFHYSPRKRVRNDVPSPESQSIDREGRTTLLQRASGGSMDLQCQVERLMSSVKLHKDAWPFLYPVNEEDAPAYYDIIKEPVDLSLIESRLFDGSYETIGDLDADFDKMVSNCELYNGEYHAYSEMARVLRKLFRKGLAKILESFPPEELKTAESEESRDSNYQSSSSSSSPPHEVSGITSKRHKKQGEKKKKRKIMDALELLAHASDLAVQDNFTKRASPPEKKSPPVQQIQTSYVPLTTMPYLPASTSASNISKISLPVTSSNFMPVNSVMQGSRKENPLPVRTNIPDVQNRTTSLGNTTSFSTIPSTNTINTLPQSNFQALNTQSVPVIFSGYNQSSDQSDSRLKNNPTVTVQSNVGLPNGVPIVQKVLIPQIQVGNTGQFMFASPQNTVRLISKEQNVQVQNNVRHINPNFGKVVPQIVTPTTLMSGLQFQAVNANNAQTFTQVSQNPQFVSIPTFMLSNQNTLQTTQQSSPPSVMNLQPFHLAQRQMHLNGPGNT